MKVYKKAYEISSPPVIGEKVWHLNYSGTARVQGVIVDVQPVDEMPPRFGDDEWLPKGYVVQIHVPSDERCVETRFFEEMRKEIVTEGEA